MPTELRYIIFSAAEIVDAAYLFRNARGLPLPPGRVTEAVALHAGSGEHAGFRMVVEPLFATDRGPTGPVRVEFTGPEVAAALVAYCRTKRIPVPAGGTKSLKRFGSGLGLVVTTPRSGDPAGGGRAAV